jgi:hypothetical protein
VYFTDQHLYVFIIFMSNYIQGDSDIWSTITRTIMIFVGPWPLTSRSNNCFLNSIIKLIMCNLVPRRLLQYVTHRLMVMHPHTKYNWPIWKDKNVMVRTSFAEKKQKKRKRKKNQIKTICLPSLSYTLNGYIKNTILLVFTTLIS